MRRRENPQLLSLISFLFLLILLPLILLSNKKEKVILSKAEVITGATPSVTLFPSLLPTPSLAPTVMPTTAPTPLPSIAPSPTESVQPTSTVTVQPSPTVILPTPSVGPQATASPQLSPSPSSRPTTAPTISAGPTISVRPPKPTIMPSPSSVVMPSVSLPPSVVIPYPTTVISQAQPRIIPAPLVVIISQGKQIVVDPMRSVVNTVVRFVADILGIDRKPIEEPVVPVQSLTTAPVETVLQPTMNQNEYVAASFTERDFPRNPLIQWYDRIMKNNRQHTVVYRVLMSPDGFLYGPDVSLTVTAEANILEEPITRQRTVGHANVGGAYYFDRYGFFNSLAEATSFYADYPAGHNRLHRVDVTEVAGQATNKETRMTLDEWSSLGLSQLSDNQGVALPVSLQRQTALIKTQYPDFPSQGLTTFELFEIISWVNSQLPDSFTAIKQSDITELLGKDDRVVIRISSVD